MNKNILIFVWIVIPTIIFLGGEGKAELCVMFIMAYMVLMVINILIPPIFKVPASKKFKSKKDPIYSLIKTDDIYKIKKWELKWSKNNLFTIPFSGLFSFYKYEEVGIRGAYTEEQLDKITNLEKTYEDDQIAKEEEIKREKINKLNQEFIENYEQI